MQIKLKYFLQIYDFNNNKILSGGYSFLLDIRDYCVLNPNNNLECNRLTDITDLHYNRNIYDLPFQKIFQDLNTGESTIDFEIPDIGWVTITIFQLISNYLNTIYKNLFLIKKYFLKKIFHYKNYSKKF